MGRKLTVIAWLWVRTVRSPNPAFADVEVPLTSTFILSKKKGKEAYVEPVIGGWRVSLYCKAGTPPEAASKGTQSAEVEAASCVLCRASRCTFEYMRRRDKQVGWARV